MPPNQDQSSMKEDKIRKPELVKCRASRCNAMIPKRNLICDACVMELYRKMQQVVH